MTTCRADFDGDGDLDLFGANVGVQQGGSVLLENRAVVGGWVDGIIPERVRCRNLTTGQTVQAAATESFWDCVELGLAVSPGDRVESQVLGTVE